MDKIDETFENINMYESLNSVYLPRSHVDDLSFSIYVDSKNHMKHHRRRIKQWVSDDSVTKCKHCNVNFTIWYRKHHCRICGRIFCYYCSNNYVVIPEEMWNDIPGNIELTNNEVRVCNQCNIDVDEFNGFYEFVKSRICDFNMIKLKKYISQHINVCDSTNSALSNILTPCNTVDLCDEDPDKNKKVKATTYCLNKLREIQYKLPTEKISSIEKDLLRTNKVYLNGHSKWDIQLLKIKK